MEGLRLLAAILLFAVAIGGCADRAAAGEPSPSAAPAAATGRSPSEARANVLAPVRVFGERDADVFMPVPKFGFRLSGLQVRFPSYETAAIVETAARASQAPAHVAPTANVLLAAAPSHGRQCRLPGLGAER